MKQIRNIIAIILLIILLQLIAMPTISLALTVDLSNDGKLISIESNEEEQEIYKGKINNGEEREFKTNTDINIFSENSINGLSIIMGEMQYIGQKMEIYPYYKKIKFDVNSIQTVLGETWKIELENQNNKSIEITNKTPKNEQGSIELALPEKTTKVKIKTSKIVNKGKITLETTKTINLQSLNKKEIKNISKIQSTIYAKYLKSNGNVSKIIKNTTEVELKNPETSAILEIDEKRIETSEINLSVILQTENESKDLYKNPELKIEFPKEIRNITAIPKIIYGNGLTLEEDNFTIITENEKKVMKIDLIGEQKKYQENLIKGTIIIINAKVDINSQDHINTKDIVLTYTNENATSYANNGKYSQQIEMLKGVSSNITANQKEQNIQTKELEKVKIEMYSKVGKDNIKNEDSVKSGEIIKYTLKLTNNSNEKKRNVKIATEIPDNTTLLELNTKYGDKEASEDYFIESSKKQILKEVDLGQGQAFIYTIYVKVNEDILEEQEGTTEIKVKINNKEQQFKQKNYFLRANLSVQLNPIERDGIESIQNKTGNSYRIMVKNLTNITQKNVQIILQKNSTLEVKFINYISGENYRQIDAGNSNFIIDEIPPYEIAYIEIDTEIQSNSNKDSMANFLAIAKDIGGDTYRSNQLSESIELISLIATMGVKTGNNAIQVKDGEEIEYILNIENTSEKYLKELKIEHKLSDYLELKNVTINNKEAEYEILKEFDNEADYDTLLINTELENDEKIQIKILAKVTEDIISNEIKQIYSKSLIYSENTLIAQIEEKPIYFSKQKNEGEIYGISGTVWIDEDKDGIKETQEENVEGVKIYAIDIEKKEIAKVQNQTEIEAITNNNGFYALTGLKKGKYIVIFEFDTKKYRPTFYAMGENGSYGVMYNEKNVAITDIIEIDGNKQNLNFGLIKINKLSFDIQTVINKITILGKNDSKTYNFYENNIANLKLPSEYFENSIAKIEYKIIIKNDGNVAGYVQNIIDYLSTDLSFNESENNNWYIKNDKIYNNSLKDIQIDVGQKKELLLNLYTTITKNTEIENKAEINLAVSTKETGERELLEEKASIAKLQITEEKTTLNIYLVVIIGILIISIAIIIILKNKKKEKSEFLY